MMKYGYPWPEMVSCEKFPLDNDMCMSAMSKSGSESAACRACSQPENSESLLDNYCRADFVIRARVRRTKSSSMIRTKNTKIFKVTEAILSKKDLKSPVFRNANMSDCCAGLDRKITRKNPPLLIMGTRDGDGGLVPTFIMEWKRSSPAFKKSIRMMQKIDCAHPSLLDHNPVDPVTELGRRPSDSKRGKGRHFMRSSDEDDSSSIEVSPQRKDNALSSVLSENFRREMQLHSRAAQEEEKEARLKNQREQRRKKGERRKNKERKNMARNREEKAKIMDTVQVETTMQVNENDDIIPVITEVEVPATPIGRHQPHHTPHHKQHRPTTTEKPHMKQPSADVEDSEEAKTVEVQKKQDEDPIEEGREDEGHKGHRSNPHQGRKDHHLQTAEKSEELGHHHHKVPVLTGERENEASQGEWHEVLATSEAPKVHHKDVKEEDEVTTPKTEAPLEDFRKKVRIPDEEEIVRLVASGVGAQLKNMADHQHHHVIQHQKHGEVGGSGHHLGIEHIPSHKHEGQHVSRSESNVEPIPSSERAVVHRTASNHGMRHHIDHHSYHDGGNHQVSAHHVPSSSHHEDTTTERASSTHMLTTEEIYTVLPILPIEEEITGRLGESGEQSVVEEETGKDVAPPTTEAPTTLASTTSSTEAPTGEDGGRKGRKRKNGRRRHHRKRKEEKQSVTTPPSDVSQLAL